jgi:hypothetical protein
MCTCSIWDEKLRSREDKQRNRKEEKQRRVGSWEPALFVVRKCWEVGIYSGACGALRWRVLLETRWIDGV